MSERSRKPKSVKGTEQLFREDYSEVIDRLERVKAAARRGEVRGVLIVAMTHDGHRVVTGGTYDRSAFVFALEDAKLRLMWEALAEMKLSREPDPDSDGT